MSTIPVVTYEDMNKSRTSFQEARSEYTKVYFNYLSTILEEVGFRNKLVRLKDGTMGQFKVDYESYSTRPSTIKFFPMRKSNEGISLRAKILSNFYPWNEQTLAQQLKDIAEVVGDLP